MPAKVFKHQQKANEMTQTKVSNQKSTPSDHSDNCKTSATQNKDSKRSKLGDADIFKPFRHAKTATEEAAEHILGANPIIGLDAKQVMGAFKQLFGMVALKPGVIAEQEVKLVKELVQVVSGTSQITPEKGDRRFAHPIWTESRFYRLVMQSYLAWRASLHNMVDESDFSAQDKDRAHYVLSLFTEAVAPTNTLLGNPGAVKNAIDSKGLSLVKGAFHFFEDLKNNGGMPKQVDDSNFKLGDNIACSEGAVVFRNPVLELIQYKATTQKVFKRPVLVIPPQINKFYIVDISKDKSFIEYATAHELQPFVISWRNPTAAQRDWNLETYVTACIEAIDAIRDISGCDDVNVLAACVGGYTAATLVGHLQASQQQKIHSMTYLVTVLDTSAPTLMGLFATESAVKAAMARSRRQGVLEGRDMARVFAWLRPNDLIWGYVANNYLMGNDPPAFDILYWNADTTRLPAEFHADVLTLFMENALAHPSTLNLLGTPIDLSKVTMDAYIVAGIRDHITPWKACYETRRIIGGNKTFVLSSSGHIQAIVNPPGNPRAKYYTHGDLSLSAEDWLENAECHQGTWWDHWQAWIQQRSGEKTTAPEALGSDTHSPRDRAPGRYVHQV